MAKRKVKQDDKVFLKLKICLRIINFLIKNLYSTGIEHANEKSINNKSDQLCIAVG